MELSSEIHDKITRLCREGDEFAAIEELAKAKSKYVEALKSLPGKQTDWAAATWIYVAIGDIYFRLGNYEKCFMCFINAVQCPNGFGNPFIHLRLGQMYYERNNMNKSADELTRAYMEAGIDIFMEDDPKYLEFIEERLEM